MFDVALSSIETVIRTQWPTRQIVFGNAGFGDEANYDKFYRAHVIFGRGRNISLGGLCIRYPCILDFAIFHRPGKGLKSVLQDASDIAVFFQNKSFGIYQFQTSTIREFPADQHGLIQHSHIQQRGLIQTLVSTDFFFDHRSS